MARNVKKRSKKAGLPPGTPVHIGDKKTENVKITVIDYCERSIAEKQVKKVEDCFPFKNKPTVTWINIDGIHQVDVIEKIGKHFNLHPLLVEDIVNTDQRPKMEDFEDYIFIVLNMLYCCDDKKSKVTSEQVSIILGSNFVISFQEREGDVFNPLRERIRGGKGRSRKMGSDYLAYSLLDSIVDNYFVILEKIDDDLESIEEKVMTNPNPKTLRRIHGFKREMIYLRKSVWPLREVISRLERSDSHLIKKTTRIYLRDVYDHTVQVIDTVETFRDMVSGILDIYLSSVSNRMNEVMKVLTVIATIFIPLTFITGWYGMNFRYMPELMWPWAYPLLLLSMALIAVVMLLFFKRKNWV